MCGIAGIYLYESGKVDHALLQRMTDAIRHRGPDADGFYVDGAVGLGHRRLAVIDIDGGVQPMIDAARQRALIYNGEIFNFRELRDELIARGESFRTRSDTEVLQRLATPDVHAWAHRLNGMFAFAQWDARARTLLVMRDRFGVKPLYYVNTPRMFAFASEIKALLQIPEVKAEIDPAQLAEYLAFRHVLEPATMLRGVRQLPGGHYIVLTPESRDVTVRRWWDENAELEKFRAATPGFQTFSSILTSAVEARLVADVPLGTFNSGGVDSSLITREVRNHKTGNLHTFSVGFSEASHDESVYAQEVAARLGTEHHAEQMNAREYAEQLPRAIWHHDEPLCHPHSVQLMHLCGVARRYVTVALTGEGADEVFAGYPRLRIPLYAAAAGPLAPWIGRIAGGVARQAGLRRLRKLFSSMSGDVPVAIDAHRFMDRDDLDALLPAAAYIGSRTDVRADVSTRQSTLEQLLEYERRSYMQSLVLRLDKMAMAHSLEARTPFLDYRMVLWSKLQRASQKIGRGWANKPVLKAECARTFSHELVYRRKVGFGVPLAQWFREQPELRAMLDEMRGGNSMVASYFPRAVVSRLVEDHWGRRADNSEPLWVLLNLHLWPKAMQRAG